MQRAETLRLAAEAVQSRNTKYGTPGDNFERIARRWNAHLENLGMEPDLTASSVAIMLADVKMARLENDPTHLDSWVDGAGYMACGAEVSGAGCKHPNPLAAWRVSTREDARRTATEAMQLREPAESRYGFTIGETVNNIACAVGDRPCIVEAFRDDGWVGVSFQSSVTGGRVYGDFPCRMLRHGH